MDSAEDDADVLVGSLIRLDGLDIAADLVALCVELLGALVLSGKITLGLSEVDDEVSVLVALDIAVDYLSDLALELLQKLVLLDLPDCGLCTLLSGLDADPVEALRIDGNQKLVTDLSLLAQLLCLVKGNLGDLVVLVVLIDDGLSGCKLNG